MKIKRLEIIGFKSFVDKASLDFQQGITAVVGPNGCGKSNIVDAIRWVMGEQSAKNLRGRSMEDIIFGGSDLRKPLGMAEVSLVFSTEDGRAPAKYLNFSEIQVTRRLYRDGDSEYFLNKTPCRLLDIAELFMDTGVGTKAYSIIEQGKIGMILLSRPEDRRFLIEEAAGVTKFKARKQVALKKIDTTRQNLLRVGDIISEIKRQLNSLQRQARKAEKFRELREELKGIELLFAAREYAGLASRRLASDHELASLRQDAASTAARLEEAELALEALRIEVLEAEKLVASSQERMYALKSDAQAAGNRLEFQRKESVGLEQSRVRRAEELAALELQRDDAERELGRLELQKDGFVTDVAEAERTLAEQEEVLELLLRDEAETVRRVDESRRELFALLSRISQINNQKTSAVRRLEGIAERLERSRTESDQLGTRLQEGVSRVAEGEASLALLVERHETLGEEQAVSRQRRESLATQSAAADGEIRRLREETSSKGSRLRSLQELEATFAGYGQGVRTLLLAEQFAGRFRGVLADFIRTDEEFETALEAVLADRMQYLVCDREADAAEAVEWLHRSAGGRCTFVMPVSAAAAGPAVSGFTPILHLVEINDDCRGNITPLLAGVYLADDLATALHAARSYPEAGFVTRNGEVAWGGGIVSGGRAEGEQQGLIHTKREIRQLAKEVDTLAESLAAAESRRKSLQEETADLDARIAELQQMRHRLELDRVNMQKDLQQWGGEVQRIRDRLAVREMEDAQLREEQAVLTEELSSVDAGQGEAEERKTGIESEIAALGAVVTVKKQEIEAVRETVTRMKVRCATLRERHESNETAITRTRENLQTYGSRIADHRQWVEHGEESRQQLAVAIAEAEAAMVDLLTQQQQAEAASVGARQTYEAVAAVLQEREAALKELRASQGRLVAAEGEKSLFLAELAMKIVRIEESVREKYRLEVAELPTELPEEDGDEQAMLLRRDELQRLVDELGEVNLMAIEEYRELEERFTFLTGQRDDLDESLGALQQAIQRINRTTRKRFIETFHLVNEKFQEVFPRLFCGGKAELRLTNEDDLLETGIEIVVQPPGKKLQNVTLLSGGEKALTAVALIFSIFLIKPSPFCLLDEVDAPLDDANIGRFNEMVREMSETSQFIMITHSKTTMTIADTLYGVTMEEPGVSKLVSVRMN
jgi:chromosome segregation protein